MKKESSGRAVAALLLSLIIFGVASFVVFISFPVEPNPIGQTVEFLATAWLVSSFIIWMTLSLMMSEYLEWPKWLEVAGVVLCLPLALGAVVLGCPFWLYSEWIWHCRIKLAGEIDKDLATLWPRLEPYRSKGANTQLEKLRALVEDKETPPKARIRIKKFLRIMEPLRPEFAEAFVAAGSK